MKSTQPNPNAYNYLLNLFVNIDTIETATDILNVLMTESEQIELSKRLEILAKLTQGQTQRQVSQSLKVGVATVSRGAKIIQKYNIEHILPDLAKKL